MEMTFPNKLKAKGKKEFKTQSASIPENETTIKD